MSSFEFLHPFSEGVEKSYIWMRTLGPPCQLLLLCHEDPFIQPLVEGPHELGSCQHTVTNGLNREEGVQRVLCSD